MKLGLAPLTLFRPPPLELVECAGKAGYEAVGFQLGLQEVPVSPLATDPQFMREAKSRIEHYGLSVMEVSNIVFEPGRTFDEGAILIDFAKEIGASIIQATIWDTDRNRVGDRLGALADYAKSAELGITIEYMPYSRCVNFEDAVDLARRAGRDNISVLLDTLHFARSGGEVSDLDDASLASYSFVQLCDARAEFPSAEELRYESVNDRLPLGEGAIDIVGILERIPTQLPISLEIPCQRLSHLTLEEQAREHLRLARAFLAPFSSRWDDEPTN